VFSRVKYFKKVRWLELRGWLGVTVDVCYVQCGVRPRVRLATVNIMKHRSLGPLSFKRVNKHKSRGRE